MLLLTACTTASIELEDPVGGKDPTADSADDSGPPDDAGQPDDSGGEDSGPPDDSGGEDSGGHDSGGDDSGGDDSGSIDSGGDSGTTEVEADCLDHGLVVAETATLAYGANVDSYDSAAGAYGGANVGEAASLAVNGAAHCALSFGASFAGDLYVAGDPSDRYCESWGASLTGSLSELAAPAELPEVSVPGDLPASSGDLSVGWGGSESLAGDAQVDALRVDYGGTLEVTADSRLRADSLSVSGTLSIAPGATLQLWVDGDVDLGWGAAVNSGGDPGQLRLALTGADQVNLQSGATLVAVLTAPDGGLTLGGSFQGGAAVGSLDAQWGAWAHVDVATVCP